MRYELRQPHEVTPFDVMVHAGPGGVIVAVPDLPDAIANIATVGRPGFEIMSCEVFDDTSNDV